MSILRQRCSQTLWRHASSRVPHTKVAVVYQMTRHVCLDSPPLPHAMPADLSSHRPPRTFSLPRTEASAPCAPLSNLKLLSHASLNATTVELPLMSARFLAQAHQLEVRCHRSQNSQMMNPVMNGDMTTSPRALPVNTRCRDLLQTRNFRILSSTTQEGFKYVVFATAAFSLGYLGPSILETTLGQGLLATACGLGLLRFALLHPPFFSRVRRNFLIKHLARHVHTTMTSTNPSDLVHRSPALLRVCLRLHEALALPHWIRDDTDSVRADLEKLCVDKVDRFNFEGGVVLGRALAMEEKNREGDRVVEGVFAVSARNSEGAEYGKMAGELHLRADGNGSLPKIEEVTLWLAGGAEAVQLVGAREVRLGQEIPQRE